MSPATSDDVGTWAAVASACFAGAAALFTGLYWRSTQRLLKLTQSSDARAQAQIKLRLIEGRSYHSVATASRVIALSAAVSNPSSSPDTVVDIELEIDYTSEASVAMTVKVPHDPDLDASALDMRVTTFDVPQAIGANGATIAWALFRVDDAAVPRRTIDGYRLTMYDVHGNRAAVETTALREIVDEAEVGPL